MKVAITGAAGYIGKQIVDKLSLDPEIEQINAIDIVKPKISLAKKQVKKIKFFTSNILDRDLVELFWGCEVVIHLAFKIGDSKNRPALYRINVDGSRNVFNSAQEAGAKKLIVSSSIAVYGYYPDNPKVIDENTPLLANTDNAYSDTKRLVEILLDDYEKRYPYMDIIRFRPGVILGANTRNNFRTMLTLPFWIEFEGDGPGFFSRTAVVHEDDVVDAFLIAIKSKCKGAYNLAVEPFVTRDEILKITKQPILKLPANLIAFLLDTAYKMKITNSPASDMYYMMYPIPASGNKAIKELGWKPKYTGLEAVRDLFNSIKKENFFKYFNLTLAISKNIM